MTTFKQQKWRLLKLSGLMLAAVGLSGCGLVRAASAPSVKPTPVPSVSAREVGSVAALSPNPVVNNPSELPSCSVGQLTVSYVDGVNGAGHDRLQVYALTSQSPSPCTLYGHPAVALLAATGQPIQTADIPVTAPDTIVTLAKGDPAWFVIEYQDAPSYRGESCPASTAFAITPPGSSSAVIVHGPGGHIHAYGSNECGEIQVQPVAPKGVPLQP
ncbi:MAG: hypothetical protein C7B45_00945 [Sulfobacillus acidophilus]|uniref:DUF4232 domain-containing protein n=1 Tax=Sulfobacillus acidophilus TaxID=53633 RepID=A0A2T2WNQ9_9FIRM|nr:MAG: hypothetical protein C7B45_00945 [Sulfobacillus acidophilus]